VSEYAGPEHLTSVLARLTGQLLRSSSTVQVLRALQEAAAQAFTQGQALLLQSQGSHWSAPDGKPGTAPWLPRNEKGVVWPVLQREEPLYLDHPGAVQALLPSLPGVTLPGMVAVVPLPPHPEATAVLVFALPEGHPFTSLERRVLESLTGQAALALGRVAAVPSDAPPTPVPPAHGLTAFVELTEAIGRQTDLGVLIRLARDALRVTQPDLALNYFVREGDRWTPSFPLPDAPAALRAALDLGLPAGTPAFAAAVQRREPLFIDDWDSTAQKVPHSDVYRMCAFAPYMHSGAPTGMLTASSRRTVRWTDEQREVFTAIWQGLGGALERAEQARQLDRQQALDAFVRFTEQSATVTDVHELAVQAVQVLRATLGDVSITYSDLANDAWKTRVRSDPRPDGILAASRDVPVSAPVYAEALRQRVPVFVDDWNFQDLNDPDSARGAGALYVCRVGDRPRGLLVMGNVNGEPWALREQAVFQAVGCSLTLALERSEQARRLEEDRAALAAFVNFSEASSAATDLVTLFQTAHDVLRSVLGDVHVASYDLQDDLWTARLLTGDMDAAFLHASRQGFPRTLPSFRQPFETGGPVIFDPWDAEAAEAPGTEMYRAGAMYPYLRDGQPFGLLTIGLVGDRGWTALERRVFLSVGRSLQLSFDRLDQTVQMAARNAELRARTRAIEGFAELTRDLTLHHDPYVLIRRAQQVVLSLLPDGYAVYFEPVEDRWILRAQTGELRNADLQSAADAGLPYRTAQNLLRPYTTHRPCYQDRYDETTDQLTGLVGHLCASATLPVMVNGSPIGVFAVVLFGAPRPWSAAERAVMESVVRALGLALERSQATRQLDEERAALEAFTAFTEAVGTQTDVQILSRQACETLRARFSLTSSAVYYEVQGNHLQARSWSSDLDDRPDLHPTLQQGIPTETPLFAEALRTGTVAFTSRRGALSQQGHAAAFGAAAVYPLYVNGDLRAFLGLGLRQVRDWTDRDAAVLRAVGRGLALALERADLTRQLQRQNARTEEVNRELCSANSELEAFTYSVSHDLRAPVRHVKGFVGLARGAVERGNTSTVSARLDVIEGAADRMSAMIDALLGLSRSTSNPMNPQWVSLQQLVEAAQQDVAPDLDGREVEWQLGPFLPLWGDPVTLQQVMTNYLANAVKFTATRERTVIRIWAEAHDRTVRVSVQDNGVGFDPQYGDRLFGAFQRLHPDRDFSGTGIGLATVRRIVLRHGGEVSAEGRVGEGATFSFTLPNPVQTEQE